MCVPRVEDAAFPHDKLLSVLGSCCWRLQALSAPPLPPPGQPA